MFAAAQIQSTVGQIDANIAIHIEMIKKAAQKKAKFIVFPEMSLTGYCREEAASLAFAKCDSRLDSLQVLADEHELIISVGAPIKQSESEERRAGKPFIGMFILRPNQAPLIYVKQYLHAGEELFFDASFDYNPLVEVAGQKLQFAICADISHPEHAKAAARSGCTLYVASIFYSPDGIQEGHEHLHAYASQHKMNVLMSNYCGTVWGMEAGGRSCGWDKSGCEVELLRESRHTILLIHPTS